MTERVKVLFVDDEENILRAITRLFLDSDYDILTAPSGQEGLRVLEAGPPVHVVISDYRMPVMNGVEFLRLAARKWRDPVRILLSGYADTPSVFRAIDEGFIYRFIPKPWNDDELRISVANAATHYFLQQRIAELQRDLKIKDEELARMQALLQGSALAGGERV